MNYFKRLLMGLVLVALGWQPVLAQEEVEIWQVQAAGHSSPFRDELVTLRDNIVTAVAREGFYVQTPPQRADDDLATSEGVFVRLNPMVFSSAPVAVGDRVTLTGRVREFDLRSRPDDLPVTEIEITQRTIECLSSGNPLPEPVVIGEGGRVPPVMVIDDDGNGSITNGGSFDADSDGIDFYESLEGMRVQINDPVVVAPRNSFGEIWVLVDGGLGAELRTARGGIVVREGDFNPERIQLDDTLYPGVWPGLSTGARFNGPVVGILTYSFDNFEVLVTENAAYDPGSLTREMTTLYRSENQLTVATYNVENIGGNLPQAEYDARGRQIVSHLASPDIVVLEEIQDNNGAPSRPGETPSTEADLTYDRLIRGIQNAGGPVYGYAQINPEVNRDGGEPGGNIRVGFLYRTDSGVGFVERPGGADAAARVECAAGVPILSASPGRIEPDNTAFRSSRKPLVGEFTYNGQTLFLVGLHLNSKGGDDALYGPQQPPVLNSEARRIEQAEVIHAFVEQILECDAAANVIVMGDLNDFDFSPPLDAIKGDLLHNLADLLPVHERYSYIFDGNSQLLDHILASGNLWENHAPELDIVHINAEFIEQLSDHDPHVARFTFE